MTNVPYKQRLAEAKAEHANPSNVTGKGLR
jgi:hypothetical protein